MKKVSNNNETKSSKKYNTKACKQISLPGMNYNFLFKLMSRTIGRTPFKWEKGRGDKCCPGPESCLPCARPVLGASVSEWHIRPWDGCHGAQRQGGVYLCQAPGGMVARGSGCVHRFSPKLCNPGIASVWDWRVVASNTYPPNHLLLKNNN